MNGEPGRDLIGKMGPLGWAPVFRANESEGGVKLKHRIMIATSGFALLLGSSVAMAVPAAATGGCPSGKLCLYRSTEFRTMDFTAASTNACFNLNSYGMGLGTNSVRSYVNNLSVKATFWYYLDGSWRNSQTIRSGGFSSDAGTTFIGTERVCVGPADPNDWT
ncbi:peptidase inhibitor family I36 protein [Streptomyces microflavus]|uniref:peptidase inhibitor family I36 protein n=1 Tax=Streptomyces microflavus TaxID=1919 RepID=UPI0038694E0B